MLHFKIYLYPGAWVHGCIKGYRQVYKPAKHLLLTKMSGPLISSKASKKPYTAPPQKSQYQAMNTLSKQIALALQ